MTDIKALMERAYQLDQCSFCNGTGKDDEDGGHCEFCMGAGSAPGIGKELAQAISTLLSDNERLRGVLKEACEEIKGLRHYANNHGGMIDETDFVEGLAALSASPLEGRE